MASYSLLFKPSVEKDLRCLPGRMVARVMKQIETLGEEPLPRQSVKLIGSEQLYRVRVGDYRVVYGVDKDRRRVVIHHVRHRRDAYRRQ
jgi:mRNA interferase RelE/StbE